MADLRLQQLHALLIEYLSTPIIDIGTRNDILKQLHTTYIVKDCKAIRIPPQVINEVFGRTTDKHPLREMLTEICCWVVPGDHYERIKAQLPDAFTKGHHFPACERTTYNKPLKYYTRRVQANEEIVVQGKLPELNGKVTDGDDPFASSQQGPEAKAAGYVSSPPSSAALTPPVDTPSYLTSPLGVAHPLQVEEPSSPPENVARFLPKADLLLLLHYLKQVSPDYGGKWADPSAVIGMLDEAYQDIARELIPSGAWAPLHEWREAVWAVRDALQSFDEVNGVAAIQNEMTRIRNNYQEELAIKAQCRPLNTMRDYDGANEKSGSDETGSGDDDDSGKGDKYTFSGYGGDNDSLYNVSGDGEDESGLEDKSTARATGTVLRPAAAISHTTTTAPQQTQASQQAFGAVQPAASTAPKRTNTFERGQIIRFQDDSSDDESDLIIFEGRR